MFRNWLYDKVVTIGVVGFTIFLGMSSLFILPYLTVNKLRNAVAENDEQAIRNNVNFSALKKNFGTEKDIRKAITLSVQGINSSNMTMSYQSINKVIVKTESNTGDQISLILTRRWMDWELVDIKF